MFTYFAVESLGWEHSSLRFTSHFYMSVFLLKICSPEYSPTFSLKVWHKLIMKIPLLGACYLANMSTLPHSAILHDPLYFSVTGTAGEIILTNIFGSINLCVENWDSYWHGRRGHWRWLERFCCRKCLSMTGIFPLFLRRRDASGWFDINKLCPRLNRFWTTYQTRQTKNGNRC